MCNIDNDLMDALSEQARASERLRMNYDLRNGPDDDSQRMLNAIEPGSVLPVHRHMDSAEVVVALRGRLVQEIFDADGRVIDSIELTPGGKTPAMSVPIGTWHSLRALEPGSVVLEIKNGKYCPRSEEDVIERCPEG